MEYSCAVCGFAEKEHGALCLGRLQLHPRLIFTLYYGHSTYLLLLYYLFTLYFVLLFVCVCACMMMCVCVSMIVCMPIAHM